MNFGRLISVVLIFLLPIQATWANFQFIALGDPFKSPNKSVYQLWPVIPFFPLGDIGQYEKTISQSRDIVRKMFWDEFTNALIQLAERGAPVELMVESMANVLMMFDQVHDMHKAKDVFNIDKTLEAQFKASLDRLFQVYDVRDHQRKIELSSGPNKIAIESYVRGLSIHHPLGRVATREEIDPRIGRQMVDDVDYVAYGTFSHLNDTEFQLTFHITGTKTGTSRSFLSRGSLIHAIDDLAKQVFDFFQKNVYPDWETPHQGLTWLPMPSNPNKVAGYTWEEANSYCRFRGYRLPYARELLMAESGGAYKPGGITALTPWVSYAVSDQRSSTEKYVYTQGNEAATGGPVQAASSAMYKGQFWCVKGRSSREVMIFEEIWSQIRKYRNKDPDIYRALETVRFELGDFGINGLIFWGSGLTVLQRMESLDIALIYLNSRGIKIKIPKEMSNLFGIGIGY